ncbi:11862_t:CDS:10 [Funneliformis caledonium]|uniref:11862_t:CDS:1 n=1 Tax=Funneliformis caledonium TaxID=1117310 RepID=A0A9N9D5V1_9GLOM|nr:11862_t:CDS:10 [Funneliformis caledonium]
MEPVRISTVEEVSCYSSVINAESTRMSLNSRGMSPLRDASLCSGKESKSFNVKAFWKNSSTVMKTLGKASDMNSKNIIHQMLDIHNDFSEALSNTTRETIKSALKRKSDSYPSESRKKKDTINIKDPESLNDANKTNLEEVIIHEEEEIVGQSLHHIMFIDMTRMKKPSYLDIDERKWRASVRQPKQPVPPSFFGEIMDEYEREINDIDELRSKFYDIWGKYRDKVIYLDNERCLFETTQAVARAFYERMHMYPSSRKKNEDTVVHDYVHDTFKEIFRDPNYDISWANTESLTSRSHRANYGRSQGRKPDIIVYRIVERDKYEETCFVEAKNFSITRNSKIGGYNLYKVAILCQGGINNIISSRGNKPGAKSFGVHICGKRIYLFWNNGLGVRRYFQISEIKLAQKLSEFNLVRKLIIEAFFFKCCIDSFYSNKNDNGFSNKHENVSPQRNSFSRHPTITPKMPRNMIPGVSITKDTVF